MSDSFPPLGIVRPEGRFVAPPEGNLVAGSLAAELTSMARPHYKFLAFLDSSRNLRPLAERLARDGTIDVEDVRRIVSEATDLGSITPAEKDALARICRDFAAKLTPLALAGLQRFLGLAPQRPVVQASPPTFGSPSTTPAAAPDASVLSAADLESTLSRAGVHRELRARLTEVVRVAPEAARSAVRRAILRSLGTANESRALETLPDLVDLMRRTPEAMTRIGPAVLETLARAVAQRRTDSERGREGLLGRRQALRAAQALLELDERELATFEGLLDGAGTAAQPGSRPGQGPDPFVERALLLKALAARLPRLRASRGGEPARSGRGQVEPFREQALREIERFAAEIHGVPREELVRTTTVLDIDDINTSSLDPGYLFSAHTAPSGTFSEFGLGLVGTDVRPDNDGLYQRWETTCVPTTAQMMLAETDPIYARRIHARGIADPDPRSETAREQAAALERQGLVTASRLRAQLLQRVDDVALSTLRFDEGLSTVEAKRFLAWIKEPSASQSEPRMREILGLVRRYSRGHPTDAELEVIRSQPDVVSQGAQVAPILAAMVAPVTELAYEEKRVTRDKTLRDWLPEIDARLRDGEDFLVAGVSHVWLISDVRGQGDERRYLLSDPQTGVTGWVTYDRLPDEAHRDEDSFLRYLFASIGAFYA